MKFLYKFIFIFRLIATINAQNSETSHEYIGMIRLADSSFITYKISFKENIKGEIQGYSTSDFYGSEKTKSKILGSLDREKGLISFIESSNISTSSTANSNEFCYLHVKNAKIISKNGKSIIKGKFKGKFENDSSCLDGTIYLIGTDFISQSKDTTDKSFTKIQQMLDATNQTILSSNNSLSVSWNANKIMLEVWDGAIVDNDQITIYADDVAVLENYTVEKQKKIIEIPFLNKICVVKILAINEGKAPPNTSNIILNDGGKIQPVITKLKKGEITTIKFKKVK